jgi:hypothetical protein
MKHMEQGRERFRMLGEPPSPTNRPYAAAKAPALAGPSRSQSGRSGLDSTPNNEPTGSSPGDMPLPSVYPPERWDNLWYFRGY